jgi:hypothetical protein
VSSDAAKVSLILFLLRCSRVLSGGQTATTTPAMPPISMRVPQLLGSTVSIEYPINQLPCQIKGGFLASGSPEKHGRVGTLTARSR